MAVTVERLVATMEARLDKYEKQMANAAQTGDRTFQRIESRGKRMETTLSRISPNFRGFIAGLVPAVTAVGTFHAAMNTLAEASALAKVADKVAVTTEELQRLRFGFEQVAGVAQGATDVALQRFSRRVAQAANGSGELYEILRQNGVALRNQDGSMRSQVDILRDYANLIKNAGSEQERLLLAFKAFDTEGAGLVNALKGGADGVNRLLGLADQAGGVIEDKLIRRAEELDDKFNAMWRHFSLDAKSAILSAVDWLDRLRSRGFEIGTRIREALGGEAAPGMRIQRAFEDAAGSEPGDAATAQLLRDRFGPQKKKTIVPDTEAIAAREAQIKKTKEVIEALTREHEVLGKTNAQKRIANELAKAGVDASTKEGQAISELVRMIEAKENALEVTNKQMDEFERRQKGIVAGSQYLADTFEQTALSIAGGAQSASEALKEMAVQLAIAAAKAAFLGQGPLAGLFGPGTLPGGNVSPTIARMMAAGQGGLFAHGGITNKPAIFGDAGPEAAVPLPDGRNIPVKLSRPANQNSEPKVTINNYASRETEARPRGGVDGEAIIDIVVKRVLRETGQRLPARPR